MAGWNGDPSKFQILGLFGDVLIDVKSVEIVAAMREDGLHLTQVVHVGEVDFSETHV